MFLCNGITLERSVSTPAGSSLAGMPGIARRLAAEGVVTEEDARKAVEASAKQKIPLVSYFVQNGIAPAAAVANAASIEFGIPLVDVRSIDPRVMPVKLVDEKLIQSHKALPLFKRGNRLFIGIADPTNLREVLAYWVRLLRVQKEWSQERLAHVYARARKRVVAGAACTDTAIRDHPYQSLAIALGVGLIIGVLVRRRNS